MRAHTNVEVREGRSLDFLRSIIAGPTDRTTPTLFYLDAHGPGDLPLRDEIELIVANFPNAVIVVDDFEVPDDPGYRYDEHAPDKRLSVGYVLKAATPPLAIYFPRARGEDETGARCGSATLTANSDLVVILDRLRGLRRWHGQG